MIMVLTAWSIAFLQDILNKSSPSHPDCSALSQKKLATYFLCARIYLAPFVGINLPASFPGLVFQKELHTNFSLLTKACQFSIVQSNTTGTTTCALYHCLHTMTYSVPVVPIGKLLQYSHRQGCGDTYITLWVVTLGIIHTLTALHKCMHITHNSNLAGTSSQSCSTVLYHVQSLQCTVIQYTSPSYFKTKSCYKYCTSTHDSCSMQLLTLPP